MTSMNLFRRWFKRGNTQWHNEDIGRPDVLLRLLIEAVARNDDTQLTKLCRERTQEIFEHFAEWRTVPREIRGDPEKVATRATTLLHVGQFFARGGHPELMALLVGNEEDNLLLEWERAIAKVQRLANSNDIQEGLASADEVLASLEASGASGPGLLSSRAKVRGLQAMMLLHLGRSADARIATASALADCEQAGDVEGVNVYRRNLVTLDNEQPTVNGQVELEIEILEQVRLAQRRTDLRRYIASNELLEKLLDTSGAAAPIVQRLRPHILGRIGFNEFKLGNVDAARGLVSAARDACLIAHDHEGAEIYNENLIAMDRIQRGKTAAPP